ncbi:hypothetical protein [Vibrio campbellii]|uniref:hypothetical protein n=1 Tax=Vibrio campbellii TaxID=680 RepID=UPI0021578BF4|nr:hypothetical protein [Vibrio campbellii]
MRESTSEKLVYLPVKLYVEVIEKPKYVCRQCDKQGGEKHCGDSGASTIYYPQKIHHAVSVNANNRKQIPLYREDG